MPDNKKTLEVLLKLKDEFSTKFSKATGKIVARARSMGKALKFAIKPITAITKGFFNWRTAILATAAAFATLHTAGKFVEAAGEFETYATQLRILSENQEVATETFERFKKIAAESPLDTSDFLKAFVQLQAVGVADAEATVQKLGDVAVLFNRQVQDIGAAFIGVEAEVLRRLGVVIDRTGAKAILTSGKIRIETEKDMASIRRALLDLWDTKFGGAMEKAKDTYTAKLNTMKGAWRLFMAETGDALLPFTKRAMDGITNFLNEHRDLVARTLKSEEIFFDLLKEHGSKVFAELSLEVLGIMKDLSLSLAEIAGSFWEPFKAASVRFLAGIGIDVWEGFVEEMLKDSDDDIFAGFWRKQLEKIQKSRPVLLGLVDLRLLDETTKAFDKAAKRTQLNVRDIGNRIEKLAAQAEKARAKLAAVLGAADDMAPKISPRGFADPDAEGAVASLEAELAGVNARLGIAAAPDPAAAQAWKDFWDKIVTGAKTAAAASGEFLKGKALARHTELRQQAKGVLQGLRTEEEQYAETLKFINEAYALNAIKLEEWGRIHDDARARVEAFRDAQAEAAKEQEARARGFAGGFELEAERIGESLRDTFEAGREMANDTAFAFEHAFSRAFDDMVTGTASVKAAFKSMAASILQDMSRIIARQLVIKPLMAGLFGGGDGGAGLLGGAISKIFHADNGGIVQGPALVQVGPIRERVSFEPLSGPGARQGSGGGTTIINQNFNVSAVAGADAARVLQGREVREAMRANTIEDLAQRPDMRSAVKGATL